MDPPIEVVDRAARHAVDNGADILIAIGGGSSIDTAKVIFLLMTNGGSIRDISSAAAEPCLSCLYR